MPEVRENGKGAMAGGLLSLVLMLAFLVYSYCEGARLLGGQYSLR
jgi:hypothetical protein